jgi:16S rRNA (uracil1498-N3)-methyltransferase
MQKKHHRFFIDSIPDEEVFDVRNERIVHQIKHVLKFEIGENFILFKDGGNDVVVSIVEIKKDTISVRAQSVKEHTAIPKRKLIAAISIVKRDKFELIVQKLTELGVHTIVPIVSARTVKQSVRIDRLELISREAIEQCGGNSLVKITEPMTLKESFETFQEKAIVFSPDGESGVSDIPEHVMMYVGPEGGWSEIDEALFKEHKATALSLGTRILRTETAAIVGAFTLLWK